MTTSPDPYEQVAEEIRVGIADQALWTRSWAEAGGDSNRAMAVYIRLRAAQVHAVYQEADRIAAEAIKAARKGDRARAAAAARLAAQQHREQWWNEHGLTVISLGLLFVFILFIVIGSGGNH